MSCLIIAPSQGLETIGLGFSLETVAAQCDRAMAITDYPTFSDSPFFFDRRSGRLPEQESGVVQVSSLVVMSQWGLVDSLQSHSATRVAYYHPKNVGNYHYGVRRGRFMIGNRMP